MEKNGELHSPGKMKEKLSLRKRLFIKKSTKVGCLIEPESVTDDSHDVSTYSNQISTVNSLGKENQSSVNSNEPDFQENQARMTKSACALNSDSSNRNGHYKTLSIIGRPRSLIEGQLHHTTFCCSPNDSSVSPSGDSNPQTINISDKRPLYIPLFNKNSQILNRNGKMRETSSLHTSPSSIKSFQQTRNSNCIMPQLSVDNLVQFHSENVDKNDVSSDSSRGCSLDRKSRIQRQSSKICQGVGSMDSLARNSLLAGQVLRLIPTEQARERNFLHGRLATNSLLGTVELEHVFPDREVKIFVGTWNMNGQPPPRELNDFLFPNSVSYVPDILAIGTQESFSERQEWEISLQEALGPSHILLHSATLGTLHLSIFIRRDLIWFCSLPEEASMSVRPGTAFRTKGAVAISFSLFGSTFLFVTAHLTAHQEKVKERVQDIKRIIRSLDLPRNLPLKHKSKDVTNNFDYVLWCGDLNFRLGEPRSAVMKWIKETQFPLPPHMPHGLLHADQLTAVLSDGAAFRDFKEAAITFPPTYKYDPGTQQFDTSSKQRAPAYTDRILFKSKTIHSTSGTNIPGFRRTSSCPSANESHTGMVCVAYNSTPSICTSDHKPVWGLFHAALRPGTDIVPLAAGLFNREVYLEGIRRRAAILDPVPGTSVVCSLQ